MEINITAIPIERGKNEATKIQIALKEDNLEDGAIVQCAYYDADNNLLKIVDIIIAGSEYSSYVNSGRSNATVKNFVLTEQNLEEA